MKRLFFLAIPFMLNLAHAQSPGHSAAYWACKEKALPLGVGSCIEAVKQGKHFDVRAVQLCEEHSHPLAITECIKAITDKKFYISALSACEASLPLAFIECLASIGEPFHVLTNQEISEYIQYSIKLIQKDHPLDASEVLYNLDKRLQPPQN